MGRIHRLSFAGRVHGLNRLVIADAAIMPFVTMANANLPTFVGMEKVARKVLVSNHLPWTNACDATNPEQLAGWPLHPQYVKNHRICDELKSKAMYHLRRELSSVVLGSSPKNYTSQLIVRSSKVRVIG